MHIIAIAAMSENRVLGNQGKIPWSIPGEQRLFREETLGSPIIMGRKTFESIGRCLPWRRNIVLSNDTQEIMCSWELKPEIYERIDDVLLSLEKDGIEKCYVCGGGQIYRAFFDRGLVDTVILTIVPWIYEWDTFFPEFEDSFQVEKREEYEGFMRVWYEREKKS